MIFQDSHEHRNAMNTEPGREWYETAFECMPHLLGQVLLRSGFSTTS